ncbi:hypothetical protein ACFSW8_04285 [Rubritalea tangerina]|uniref:Uncharacterized protein n=1 Tax=Rubritalea tangerina TaxID=430798 RepID=A0ABW4Z8W0_9BACT
MSTLLAKEIHKDTDAQAKKLSTKTVLPALKKKLENEPNITNVVYVLGADCIEINKAHPVFIYKLDDDSHIHVGVSASYSKLLYVDHIMSIAPLKVSRLYPKSEN